MPYQERYSDFERQYGNIEMNGITYNYVKRKIDGDVVIFKCIPNAARQELKGVHNELAGASSSTGTDHNGNQNGKISLIKTLMGDYEQQYFTLPEAPVAIFLQHFTAHTYTLPHFSPVAEYQPPDC